MSDAGFAELLRRHRAAAGVSQETLAERARMSVSAIGALERGARRAPYRETVALIAAALGLSPAERSSFEAAAERARGRRRPTAESAVRHNLPERPSSFVGREREIGELVALLEGSRLVTLTGAGGIGKTRTAMEAARRLLERRHDEVWFVDLSSVASGAWVASTVATVLGVRLADTADPLPLLARALKGRRCLVLLDNCEHVIDDAAAVAGTILRYCPGISIVATSRERLAIEGESVYRLTSLRVPASMPVTEDEACTYASFQLFMDRAHASEARLCLTAERVRAVAEICQQLEGIPLAIELAATRLPTLGLDALNQRLHDHFLLLGGARDLPERHQTMLATIAWSYGLLSEPERTLFRRLAIFSGGAPLHAAEAACSDAVLSAGMVAGLLAALVEKSLLTAAFGRGEPRYLMLDSVRTFALQELRAVGEFPAMARAHAAWAASVGDAGEERYAQLPPDRFLHEFGPELDNARAAIDWALNAEPPDAVVMAGRIVGGLRGLWTAPERRGECRRWANGVLDRIDAERHPVVAARVMRALLQSVDGSDVFAVSERAIPLFERIGDRRGLISLQAHLAWEHALRGAFRAGEAAIAEAFRLAAAEGVHHSRQYAHLLQARCLVRALAGRLEEARADAAAADRLRTAIGHDDPRARTYWDAFFAFTDGDVSRAATLLGECVQHARVQSQSLSGPLSELAAVQLVLGETDLAADSAHVALELAHFEQLDGAWRPIQHLAAVAAKRGDPQAAALLLGFVDRWCANGRAVRGYYEQATHALLRASLDEQLAPRAIAALLDEGGRLGLERAAEHALSL